MRANVRPIGQLLLERGVVTDEDLNNALALQKERRESWVAFSIDLGYVAERDVIAVLSDQLKIPIFSGEYPAVPIEAAKIPFRFLRNFHAIPVHLEENGTSPIVMADPLDFRNPIRHPAAHGF